MRGDSRCAALRSWVPAQWREAGEADLGDLPSERQSRRSDSNRCSADYKSAALPTKLRRRRFQEPQLPLVRQFNCRRRPLLSGSRAIRRFQPPARPASTTVQSTKRGSQRVAVGAEKREIRRRVVLPVAVDVLDLHHHATCNRVSLAPAAAAAPFADLQRQIASDELRVALAGWIETALKKLRTAAELVDVLAVQRTILCDERLATQTTSGRAIRARFFRVHGMCRLHDSE